MSGDSLIRLDSSLMYYAKDVVLCRDVLAAECTDGGLSTALEEITTVALGVEVRNVYICYTSKPPCT